MNDQSLDSILFCLADKLPDPVLLYLFPHEDCGHIRSELRNAAELLKDKKPAVVHQHNIIHNDQIHKKVLLYTDGASRGNPGKAGAGIVILDNGDEEIAARSFFLGECTNNMAEYKALLLGLEEAVKLQAQEINIFLDSELVVRQINGRYRVKHPDLIELHSQVKKRLDTFSAFQIHHIPREKNRRADKLANLGIDEHQFGVGA